MIPFLIILAAGAFSAAKADGQQLTPVGDN
jgi:hypothetical protein